tara:strand:- start:409 stop:1524 length:1116 start_codon:yes stop_codon:yes gene_type:complete
MSIFRDCFVKESPIFTGISRGVGGFGYGASGGAAGPAGHVDHISGLSGDGTKIVTDGVTFYQANHAVQLNNPATAPSFQFTTAQPFYVAMIGASGAAGYNNAPSGLGGIGVALVTPGTSTTYRLWSGVGGYWSNNNTSSHEKAEYRGGAGGIGNQTGLSNTYRIQGGGGGAGALIRGTGGLSSSGNILAMVGSGGGSGNGGGAGAGHGGGFNRNGVTKTVNGTANGQGATTSSAGDGGTFNPNYASAGNGGGFLNGGQGGNSDYDAGHGGGCGWYGGGGGSGGGGFSGGAGGGGSGKTQNVSGDTVDLSSPLTNTADGSTTGSTDLQTWIRAASGVNYVIPNNGNYGMQADHSGSREGHAGWACVWSYHAL